MALELILRLFLWLIGFYLLWRIPSFAKQGRSRDGSATGRWPRVSVIVPARNEEHRIGRLLRSLADQTQRPQEIIVVDDGSSDGTGDVAQNSGAAVLRGQPLPPGWSGKPWACWQGAQKATGQTVVFLDADTWLEPNGLYRIVGEWAGKGGLVSVQPYHVTRKPYEQLSAFFNMILMAAMNAFTPHGETLQPGGAFGPCLVCGKKDYLALGGHGHEKVRGAVLESIPLAGLFRANGLRVHCYGGRGAIAFRMYPGGLPQLVEGWSKGFGSGAISVRFVFLALTVAWVTGYFSATVALLGALGVPSGGQMLAALLVYSLYALQIWWILRRIGCF